MQGQLEFQDSEVRSVTLQNDILTLAFSATLVHVDGLGRGYVQSLAMVCTAAHVEGAWAEGMGRLANGRLWLDGGVPLSGLPFPYIARNPLHLELQFFNGIRLLIRASTLECAFTGDSKFSESFAC